MDTKINYENSGSWIGGLVLQIIQQMLWIREIILVRLQITNDPETIDYNNDRDNFRSGWNGTVEHRS